MVKLNTYKNVDDFAKKVLKLDEHEIWMSNTKCKMIKHIIKSRKEQGLTQKDLAEMLGTTQSVISRMENGPRKGITLDYLTKVISTLGMSPRLTVRKAVA